MMQVGQDFEQAADFDGFGEKIVAAGGEGLLAVFFHGGGGEGDDGGGESRGAEGGGGGMAVHAGYLDVHEDEVEVVAGGMSEGGLTDAIGAGGGDVQKGPARWRTCFRRSWMSGSSSTRRMRALSGGGRGRGRRGAGARGGWRAGGEKRAFPGGARG